MAIDRSTNGDLFGELFVINWLINGTSRRKYNYLAEEIEDFSNTLKKI